MSYSIQRATSDGTLSLIDISIKYLFRDEISVLFDGIVDALPWAWVGEEEKKISFSPAVPNGVEVTIKRTTDISTPLHVLTQGAQFTNRSMDENFTQILHISQEAKEGSGLGDIYQNLNFHGYKAVNVGDGSADMDAVNHRQMQVHDATIVGYKDAAAASAAEAEYWAGVAEEASDLSALLRKDDNLASVVDKPAARTNLGLGTAATRNTGTSTGQVPLVEDVLTLGASLLPTGCVLYFATSSAPSGFLKADGSLVSRSTYAALFAVIGTTYGAGDGSTTFALPDLRGEFIRGLDDGRGVDAGRALGSAQSGQNKSHTHTGTAASAGAHTHLLNVSATPGSPYGSFLSPTYANVSPSLSADGGIRAAGAHTHSLTIDAEGGTEARPRNVALLACIKY